MLHLLRRSTLTHFRRGAFARFGCGILAKFLCVQRLRFIIVVTERIPDRRIIIGNLVPVLLQGFQIVVLLRFKDSRSNAFRTHSHLILIDSLHPCVKFRVIAQLILKAAEFLHIGRTNLR